MSGRIRRIHSRHTPQMTVGNSTRQFEHFEGDFVYDGSALRPLTMTRQTDCNTFPAIECRYGVARTETTSKIAPTIQTVFVPLKSIFIAAGSWRKLLLAPHSTCEPVSRKKPICMAEAPHVMILRLVKSGSVEEKGFTHVIEQPEVQHICCTRPSNPRSKARPRIMTRTSWKKKVGRYTRKCTGEIERKCNARCRSLDVRHEMMRTEL